jgi:hypothetical protein
MEVWASLLKTTLPGAIIVASHPRHQRIRGLEGRLIDE